MPTVWPGCEAYHPLGGEGVRAKTWLLVVALQGIKTHLFS